jgi:hypothetical protein
MCYSGSASLSTPDVAALVRLMVLINHGQLFFEDAHFEDPATMKKRLADLQARCSNVLATRCDSIMQVRELTTRRGILSLIGTVNCVDPARHCGIQVPRLSADDISSLVWS